MPTSPHVFSMSCKVTAVQGDLATPEGRTRAIDWWRRHGFTKLWLESYRHGIAAPSDLLAEERDAFRAEGFEVCGMITPTMLNDPAPGASEPQMVVCWSDPVARERLKDEVARAARLFDTVILDDFLFSSCDERCPRCSANKARRGIADLGEYRRALMFEVCEKEILPAAKAANPNAHFIIKYPCWYRNYAQRGYSPARQAELFGECWIGTETRDANPEPLQACWIMAWMDALTGGRCEGGWYDALDCTPEKFVEQGYYTILGGARESLVHCYDYLLAEDPGRTPFGEKTDRSHACRGAFERHAASLRTLAARVRGAERGPFEMLPCGVSRHEFRNDGQSFAIYLNTKDEPVAVSGTGLTLAPHELREATGDIHVPFNAATPLTPMAPTPTSRRRVTFLGDALCESRLLQAHAASGGHDFRPVFAPLRDYLAASDYVVANLETPISPDGSDLTHERWCFNSPRAFAEALQWAGVDFVTTANNHCLDRGTAGIAATIGALDDIGLPHTGTFATREASATPAIAAVGDFRLGLLSYTYGTNAFSNHEYLRPGEEFMVNLFQEQELAEPLVRAWYADRNSPEGRAYAEMERNRWPENLTLPIYERVAPHDVQRARFAADVARMRAAEPDFVALGMHTGGQYNPEATKWTKELAAFAQSCGVDFVIGNHEHTIHGGDFSHFGEGKLTTYCLGDLSSCTGLWAVPEGFVPRVVTFSIAWHIDLERAPGGAARVAGTSFGVLARRRGESEGRVIVHPAAELWRALPAGAEKDALAADIREAASIFAGRSFADAPIADEYPL